MTHLNIVIITASQADRVVLTSALSSACGQLPGGKPSDPDQLRRAAQADQSVSVEYATARHTYAQMVPAPGLDPQSFLFLAGMADGAVLLVSGRGHPPPAVCSQLSLLRAAGVRQLIVLVSQDAPASGRQEGHSLDGLRTFLARWGYDPQTTPVVSGAIRGPGGIQTAKHLLEGMDRRFANRATDDRASFLLAVEDVFNIKGRGVVVTGMVERGTVRPGDGLEVVGEGQRKAVSCRAVEWFRGNLEVARPGDNVGILLGGVGPGEVTRGAMLSAPGCLALRRGWEGMGDVLTPAEGGVAEGLPEGWRGRAVIGRADVETIIHLAGDRERLHPGERGAIVATIPESVAIEQGFTLVLHSRGRVVAVGRVTAFPGS